MEMFFSKTIQDYKENHSYYSLDLTVFKNKGVTKEVNFPSFVLDIENENELNHFTSWVGERENYNVGFVQYPILSAKNILSKKIAGIRQQRLDGSQKESTFAYILRNKLILINPQMELTYKAIGNVRGVDFTGLPKNYSSTVKEISKLDEKNKKIVDSRKVNRRDAYLSFLKNLGNTKDMTNHVSNFSDKQVALGADIIQTATPVIRDQFISALELVEDINALTKKLYLENYVMPVYNLHTSVFKDSKISNRILKAINKNKHQLIGIRILDSSNFDRKEYYYHLANLKEFVEGLSLYKENFGLHTIFFDVDAIGFFLTAKGMDGFSTKINGEIPKSFRFTSPIVRKPKWEFGKYFLYDKLINIDYGILQQIKENNNNKLPCFCEDCIEKNEFDLKTLPQEEKTVFGRRHYLNTIQNRFDEFKADIKEKRISKAFNTLEHSACRQYRELL